MRSLQQTSLKKSQAKKWKISINEDMITEYRSIVAKGEIVPDVFKSRLLQKHLKLSVCGK